MTGHTPGPWKVVGHVYSSGPGHEHKYWHVNQAHDGLQNMGIADVWGSKSGEEDEVNARLIAAAPDLYEAARKVWEHRPDLVDAPYSPFGVSLIGLRNAIAKVEGKDKEHG